MMKRRVFVSQVTGLVAIGVAGRRAWAQWTAVPVKPTPITVFKSSTCECCAKWVDHLRESDFAPVVHDKDDMDRLKDKLGVPGAVRSCHTAQLEGYLIEGHVPAADIRKLLAGRPKTAGLAVPGMPPRTHGMAGPGVEVGGYEVIQFQHDGATQIFARH